jgi:hypothetical protein
MKTQLLRAPILLLAMALVVRGQEGDTKPLDVPKEIPESVFSEVDGIGTLGIYFDLPGGESKGDRIYARYSPMADSGVEVERVDPEGAVKWRSFVEGLGVAHSAYSQDVRVGLEAIEKKKIWVIIRGAAARSINVELDLNTGVPKSRKVDGVNVPAVEKPASRELRR